MDGESLQLEKKLASLLREAAEVSVALDRSNGTIQGVPHYSVIEGRAHELGRQLSRQIQQRQVAEIVAAQAATASCPGCGRRRHAIPTKRSVTSVDGDIELQELEGYCPSCRRAFFPAEGDIGV
jgi:Zn finger protein HypA/HybF involved in hydrogenase expression